MECLIYIKSLVIIPKNLQTYVTYFLDPLLYEITSVS